ncbi:hypothetical protein [Klebsiella pneumoniae]|uniref:hypothetical protein n=1 Tax=Klebsiella pneumoniae TaxID=573 RepID=UPI000D1BECAD|nr:hypothetical protein [Klebsiella pneumoniae]
MSIEKIKEIMKKKISNTAKLAEIDRVLRTEIDLQPDGPQFNYVDLTIDKDKIYKLRELLPEDRKILEVEIRSVQFINSTGQTVYGTPPTLNTLKNPGGDTITDGLYCTSYTEESPIEFKLIFGFNIRAARCQIINKEEIEHYPIFTIRIHLEEKTNGNN